MSVLRTMTHGAGLYQNPRFVMSMFLWCRSSHGAEIKWVSEVGRFSLLCLFQDRLTDL